MKKVFLYLYPIEEYSKVFVFSNQLYDSQGYRRPFDVMNECVEKRYRSKGYTVVWAIYPDRKPYGVEVKNSDKIIYTDVSFEEASGYDKNGKEKSLNQIKYPNEQILLQQLGNDVEKIVIGGYHAMDCVRKVGEVAIGAGINTMIDLDLTDFFVSLYRREDYFNIDEYSPARYREFRMKQLKAFYEEDWSNVKEEEEKEFDENFSSPAYGFNRERKQMKPNNEEVER